MADIIQSEIYVVRHEVDKVKGQLDEQLGDLHAMLEEVELRISLAKKDIYEFKRDIIIGAEDPRTGKIQAERMLHFMEEQLHDKDTSVEKLKLKNMVLKSQIQKLEHSLTQKEEMGEDLHVIDFDQLKIENQQYLERIEEKNRELLQLKLTTGKTVQILNTLKNKLQHLTKQGEFLRRQIALRQDQLRKIDGDVERAGKDAKGLESRRQTLRMEEQDPDAPQIMDYVRLKVDLANLEKDRSEWQRKVEISTREDEHATRMLRTLQRTAQSGNWAKSTGGGTFHM